MYKIHKEAPLLLSNLNCTKETVKISKEFIKVESACVNDVIEYLTNYKVALHKKQRKPKVNTAVAKKKLIDCKLCGIFFKSEDEKSRHFRCQHTTKYHCSVKIVMSVSFPSKNLITMYFPTINPKIRSIDVTNVINHFCTIVN